MADKVVLQKKDGERRSPLEPSTLKLITAGRTSGLPHAVVVRFVFFEGAYFVMGRGRKSDWFLNALASKGGKVRVGDHVQTR